MVFIVQLLCVFVDTRSIYSLEFRRKCYVRLWKPSNSYSCNIKILLLGRAIFILKP